MAPQCCAMRTDTGSANFHFRVRTSVRLDATLRSPNKDGTHTSYDDRTYIRQVDEQVVCAVALPRPGGYFVDVYVTSSWEPDTMDLACVFRVRCTAALPSWMSASFPPGTCFGRTPLCSQLGLAEQTHTDPYVEHKGELVVAFSLAADVRLSHTLQRFVKKMRCCSPLVVPVVGVGRPFCPLLTFLSLRSLSLVSNSFYIMLLFSILLPLFPDPS